MCDFTAEDLTNLSLKLGQENRPQHLLRGPPAADHPGPTVTHAARGEAPGSHTQPAQRVRGRPPFRRQALGREAGPRVGSESHSAHPTLRLRGRSGGPEPRTAFAQLPESGLSTVCVSQGPLPAAARGWPSPTSPRTACWEEAPLPRRTLSRPVCGNDEDGLISQQGKRPPY